MFWTPHYKRTIFKNKKGLRGKKHFLECFKFFATWGLLYLLFPLPGTYSLPFFAALDCYYPPSLLLKCHLFRDVVPHTSYKYFHCLIPDCSLTHQWLLNNERASLVAQLVKNPPTMWETWVQSMGWEDPLEKGKATHSGILAGVTKSQTQLKELSQFVVTFFIYLFMTYFFH